VDAHVSERAGVAGLIHTKGIAGPLQTIAALLAASQICCGRRESSPVPKNADSACQINGASFLVCSPAKTANLRLHYKRSDGEPYGSVAAFIQSVSPPPLLAMNAGMYHASLAPVGLYVEDGRVQTSLNQSVGDGNFFIQPNGVFAIQQDGTSTITTTASFVLTDSIRYATQSGPMLIVNGVVNSAISAKATAAFTRNAVCVTTVGDLKLVVATAPVTMFALAMFMRDSVGCSDALYFDGAVSALAVRGTMLLDPGAPAGPIRSVL
jgi:uncharacterized protein YigE (DUF2233 family)